MDSQQAGVCIHCEEGECGDGHTCWVLLLPLAIDCLKTGTPQVPLLGQKYRSVSSEFWLFFNSFRVVKYTGNYVVVTSRPCVALKLIFTLMRSRHHVRKFEFD